jgi:acylphosphatase
MLWSMTSAAAGAGPETWHCRAHGRVQGVGYRQSCIAQAQALGLCGWVRNRLDGTVELQLQGEPEALARMAGWLQHEVPGARVDQLEVVRLPAGGERFTGFERRATA